MRCCRMTRLLDPLKALVLLAGAGSVLFGCARNPSTPQTEGRLQFRIVQQSSTPRADGALTIWLASYDVGGKRSRFLVEMLLRGPQGQLPFVMSKGAIFREQESDSTVFLNDLARALGVKAIQLADRRVAKLSFDVAILGTNLSRSAGGRVAGAFNSVPPGPWISTKIFLAGGAAEIYLNLNPADGLAEFAIKDPESGDTILRELSRVLQ